MYSQAQLESFFGSNYDASTLPIAFTHNGIMAIIPFLVIIGLMFIIIHYQNNKQARKELLTVVSTASNIINTDSTPNQIVSNAVNISEILDIEEYAEQSFYSAENVTAIDINTMNDTAIQSLIYALENNVKETADRFISQQLKGYSSSCKA